MKNKTYTIPGGGSVMIEFDGSYFDQYTYLLALRSSDRCNIQTDGAPYDATFELNGTIVMTKPSTGANPIEEWYEGFLVIQNTGSSSITVEVSQVGF